MQASWQVGLLTWRQLLPFIIFANHTRLNSLTLFFSSVQTDRENADERTAQIPIHIFFSYKMIFYQFLPDALKEAWFFFLEAQDYSGVQQACS